MLVDAINHRLPEGATETTVLGPFFVASAPDAALGIDISAGKPGEPLFIEARVTDAEGQPLVGAVVDVWHSDKDGYYDVQHYDEGGEMSLRARFRTDESGRVWLWTIVPSFYPIPDDGPVGDMLRAQGRHPYRPAHVHFMIAAPDYETLVTAYLRRRRQISGFGCRLRRQEFLGAQAVLERREAEAEAGGRVIDRPYAVMRYDFALAPRLAKR